MRDEFPYTQRPDRPVFPVILHTVHSNCEMCEGVCAEEAMDEMADDGDGYSDRRDDDFLDLLHGAIAHAPGAPCTRCPKDGE